ncbi:MAG: transporter substrate-binding domain-containing protein, partial [Tumebacillaceae bacterium]
MKKSFVTLSLTAVLASAVLTGCGQTQDNSASPSTPKAGEKVLTMATSADYPPYESHDTTSGSDQIVGFDIDIANWIAKDQGFTLKVVDT